MEKVDKKKIIKKEKAIQPSLWNYEMKKSIPNGKYEYVQITKNMPFTLRIIK